MVRFANREHAKKALVNRKSLKNIDRTSIGLEKLHSIFINENVTPANNKIVFRCRKVKHNSRIAVTYSRYETVQIVRKDIEN